MNSIQIKYFLTVCKHLNFTRASEELYISQPAVSKQIQALEEELGVFLFARAYRDVRLTPAGEIYRKAFLEMAAALERADDEASRLSDRLEDEFVIGFFEMWNVRPVLQNAVETWRRDFPANSLAVECMRLNDLKKRFREGRIHLLVTLFEKDIPLNEYHCRVVGRERLRLFYSPALFSRSGTPTLADFKDCVFFPPPERNPPLDPKAFVSLCREYGFTPKIKEQPNTQTALASAEAGLGAALFDELFKVSRNPNFRFIDLPLSYDIVVLWKDDVEKSKYAKFAKSLTVTMGG